MIFLRLSVLELLWIMECGQTEKNYDFKMNCLKFVNNNLDLNEDANANYYKYKILRLKQKDSNYFFHKMIIFLY